MVNLAETYIRISLFDWFFSSVLTVNTEWVSDRWKATVEKVQEV